MIIKADIVRFVISLILLSSIINYLEKNKVPQDTGKSDAWVVQWNKGSK